MGKDTFFFEEDPAAEESGITGQEHADTFFSVLEEEGIIKDRQGILSFDPLKTESLANTTHVKSPLVDIEFGIVANDYVVHVTPTHPQKNLARKNLLEQAVKTCVVLLNQTVPQTLRVDIFLPRTDWEIKATSFVIREAADAWNFDREKIEQDVIPKLLEQVGKICMQA